MITVLGKPKPVVTTRIKLSEHAGSKYVQGSGSSIVVYVPIADIAPIIEEAVKAYLKKRGLSVE